MNCHAILKYFCVALDVAGPERLAFTDVVLAYRRWLGWRPPIRNNAAREIVRGAIGDNSEWRRLTGIEPRTLSAALSAEPASVQERWFAQVYFLKTLAFGVFAAFRIATGLVSLGPGWDIGRGLMLEGGVGEPLASLSVIAGALADIAIGIAIAFRRTARIGLYAALAISVFYLFAGTALVPVVWMQMKMRNLAEAAVRDGGPLPPAYHRLFWTWFAFGFPAFAAVIAIFWLMIARPQITWFGGA